MKEHFHLPARAVPVDQLYSLIEVSDLAVAQQSPFDRRDACRRINLPRDDAGGTHGPLRPIRQFDPLRPDLLAHFARLLAGAAGHRKTDRTQWRTRRDLIPQFAPIGQGAVVLRADQPVGWTTHVTRLDDQRQDIGFPVSHIHQSRRRHAGSLFRNPLIALDPACTLADATTHSAGALRLTCPHPCVQYAQRFALRGDRVGRVNIHAALRLIRQRSQPGNRLAVEIQFDGVLNAQHHLAGPHPLSRALPVRRQNIGPLQLVLRQKTIGCRRLGPATAGVWNARRRTLCQLLRQQYRPPVQAFVTEIETSEFRCRPACRCPFHLSPIRNDRSKRQAPKIYKPNVTTCV
ncbi:hypothetical protein R75465_08596 [Paraburkholderia aspalathi]|nr:hypothetical protein R75465_08596 [Paraburkholderia aspalathi]